MSYDALAPFYESLERLTFGRALQAARVAPLQTHGRQPKNVLLLGDGDGRFLEQALATWKEARFVSMDQSGRMLACAARRARGLGNRVRFVQADLHDGLASLEAEAFEVIVSHFVLDCFPEERLVALLPLIEERLAPQGMWFVSEFSASRWWQRALLWAMYRFFHGFTETEAARFPDYRRLLEETGWRSKRLGLWRRAFVVAEAWQRESSQGCEKVRL